MFLNKWLPTADSHCSRECDIMFEEDAFQPQQHQERCAQYASSCAHSHYQQQEYFLMICSCQAFKPKAVVLLHTATSSDLSPKPSLLQLRHCFFSFSILTVVVWLWLFLTLISHTRFFTFYIRLAQLVKLLTGPECTACTLPIKTIQMVQRLSGEQGSWNYRVFSICWNKEGHQ